MSIKTKEFFSLKNLAVLMSMIIILPAYQCHINGILLLFIAIAAIFCGYKIKNQDTIKYSLLAWGVPSALLALLIGVFDLRFAIPMWGFWIIGIVILAILAFGIYKSVNKLDKINLCIEIALCVLLITPTLNLVFSIHDSPIIGITVSSIPFILFFLLFFGFIFLSCKETSNDGTKKACYISIIGSVVNLLLFGLYIAFVITLPEHSSDDFFDLIPQGQYPFYDWCQSMDGKVIIFVIAGLAMAAYYINLGIRSKWKLSKICVSGIAGMFGIGVITAFVAGNMNEYVFGLNVQDIVPLIYFITASLIVYSNIKLIKHL